MMKILFISLGCDKNLVDSEKMLGLLEQEGYEITDDETEADIIVINTCAFIHDAQEESIQSILEMAEYRKSGSCRVLIVAGCLAQRYQREIMEEIGEVDAVLGSTSADRILEAIRQVLSGREHCLMTDDINRPYLEGGRRLLTTGGHYAYLKIAEGCNKHCTYCIIPKLRGRYRSVPMELLVQEAWELVQGGVKELILVAQETTLYGVDLYGEKSLHLLIRKLCRIPGLRWVRVLYCYPEEIYEELIRTMEEEPKFCHYLDLPIQHANDEILKRMGRRTTKRELTAMVETLRQRIPDIVLRTTLITGFPGETQQQHQELMEFVDEMEFQRLGVFTYSAEEGTPAAAMAGQIPEEVKTERRQELMELQQEVAFDLAEEQVGKCVTAMVEGQISGENAYVARTYGDAPGVDGYLFIHTDEVLMSGDFARVKITGACEYDLIGELVK